MASWLPSLLVLFAAATSCDTQDSMAALTADLEMLRETVEVDFERKGKGPTSTCWGLMDRPCDETEVPEPLDYKGKKAPAEACSSSWDYGWCNGCVCAHCQVPPSALEACKGFDPKETCADFANSKKTPGYVEDQNTNYAHIRAARNTPGVKGRETSKFGNWCGCCDIMWDICYPTNEEKFKEYISKYNWRTGLQGHKFTNAKADYSIGHGECPTKSQTNEAWKKKHPEECK